MNLKLKRKFSPEPKKQRGYTMVEMTVAIAVLGIIAGICGLALQQIVTVPEKGDTQVDALHELQNAVYWVGQDAGSAQAAVGGASLTLTMPDDTEVLFNKSGTTLNRIYGGSVLTIARNITNLKFTVNGRLVTMEITSTPESRWSISENCTYQVAMRPSGT
jgi:prepilin-type N-terminal cleavage/methylation domain-containing protein